MINYDLYVMHVYVFMLYLSLWVPLNVHICTHIHKCNKCIFLLFDYFCFVE